MKNNLRRTTKKGLAVVSAMMGMSVLFAACSSNDEKGVAGGVKGGAGAVCPENRIVVAPLAVFGLVIDRAKLDLHLAGGVVALKV